MRPARIVVFAKAPVAGRVKTRLVPALGEEGAARLAARMLEGTLAEAGAVSVAETELCAEPDQASEAWCDLLPRGEYHRSAQDQGDLGERLARAAERVIAAGQRVLLIGTDCPALTSRRLTEACRELETHDAVIHPTFDGGYALLGLTRFDPSLFTDIAWSTDSVARTTLGRIRALGWTVHLAATLRDIDEPEDLAFLPASLKGGTGTRSEG
jgi:rSAM/selenodomain-associated transferase 1